jgi:hypothetical protein
MKRSFHFTPRHHQTPPRFPHALDSGIQNQQSKPTTANNSKHLIEQAMPHRVTARTIEPRQNKKV